MIKAKKLVWRRGENNYIAEMKIAEFGYFNCIQYKGLVRNHYVGVVRIVTKEGVFEIASMAANTQKGAKQFCQDQLDAFVNSIAEVKEGI